MHPHLELVKINQTQGNSITPSSGFSEMAIIDSQGRLMEAGSLVFKAIKSGELANILFGLVALAYAALSPLAQQEAELPSKPHSFPQVYEMLAIMRLLSDSINTCSSGEIGHYATLYFLCAHLSRDFLNADFDKAFRLYAAWYGSSSATSPQYFPPSSIYDPKHLDLSDCLFE